MTPLETKLTAALLANAALRVQAERLIAAYVAPESDKQAIASRLIRLFDGHEQREAERLRGKRSRMGRDGSIDRGRDPEACGRTELGAS